MLRNGFFDEDVSLIFVQDEVFYFMDSGAVKIGAFFLMRSLVEVRR